MKNITRRNFLKTTLATAAAVNIPFPSITQEISPSDEVRVAVIGFHGRGGDHISGFSNRKGVRLTALCDVDSMGLDGAVKRMQEKGIKIEPYKDVRKLLESKGIDAVSIATPNHWHSLMAIWAMQAGKDVYVEKPISHVVREGRRVMEAAQKYGRMLQHGTQQRSDPGRASEIAAVQSGKYGKLLVSKGFWSSPVWGIGHKESPAPPAELDFNLWLGPAPEQPYHGNLVHYNWHWFWDFGNGDIGNQGIHEVDVARWAIKGAQLPARVWSLGGRFAEGDQGQTPNMQMAVLEFGD